MIDPNFAPDGFEAVSPDVGCRGCAFIGERISFCEELGMCHDDERPDGEGVIFVVRTQSQPATANFPHDDMGAPV